jgi:hypothetical protein
MAAFLLLLGLLSWENPARICFVTQEGDVQCSPWMAPDLAADELNDRRQYQIEHPDEAFFDLYEEWLMLPEKIR